MKRLAIISSHPIQYYAPFFKLLAQQEGVELKVFYTWNKGAGKKHDPGFGRNIEWDIPLLEGYPYVFVNNISKDPGSHHYKGIVCPTLNAEVEAFNPNALLIYGWNFHAHLRAMKYFKGKIPVWFRGDSTLLDYDIRSLNDLFKSLKSVPLSQYSVLSTQYLRYLARKFYLTRIYRHIDKAFYVGTRNKEYYLEHGLKEDQLVWMPHAVDNEFFSILSEEREEEAIQWRRNLGIQDDDFVLLFAGKFEHQKNPELLVKAIIAINEEAQLRVTETQGTSPVRMDNSYDNKGKWSPDISTPPLTGETARGLHLIMVGNGKLEFKLKALAENKKYIHFLPFQNQSKMPVVYRLGNIFCLTSQSETWGLAINEAMLCKRLCLVSNKVGCAIDLIAEKNGIFESNNLTDLVNKIKYIHTSFTSMKRVDISKYSLQTEIVVILNALN